MQHQEPHSSPLSQKQWACPLDIPGLEHQPEPRQRASRTSRASQTIFISLYTSITLQRACLARTLKSSHSKLPYSNHIPSISRHRSHTTSSHNLDFPSSYTYNNKRIHRNARWTENIKTIEKLQAHMQRLLVWRPEDQRFKKLIFLSIQSHVSRWIQGNSKN